MLSELQIRDFVIVDRLYLSLKKGMSVFTGETGAGKSIAIDALGIVLGDRVDSSIVRHGAKRAEITAGFDVSDNSAAQRWLSDNELDEDGECILRRTINKESGSRAYINGRPVPLQRIKELAERLIDIHSQHQHQSLLRNHEQRELLDHYGKCEKLRAAVKESFDAWQQACHKKEELLSLEKDRQTRLEFLRFQLDEFEKLSPQDGEWQSIESEHATLANKEKIEAAITSSLEDLYDGNNTALDQINKAITALGQVSDYNSSISNSVTLLNAAVADIEEASADLRSVTDDSEWDPARFSWLEERIASFVSLARKHRCDPEALNQTQQQLVDELELLRDAETAIENMDQEIAQLLSQYQEYANQLSAAREKSAVKLSKAVTKLLPTLGMKGAEFKVDLAELPERRPSRFGNENIAFLVNTNKGQTPQAIQKVASGGELSRISLAIQVVTAKVAHIPSMVFDEVDVGIGGATAEVVGKMLRQLAQSRQVICITHQPQVAAQGHQHYLVEKRSTKTETSTQFTLLSTEKRKDEVARMLGGIKVTSTTLDHAQEMLEQALD